MIAKADADNAARRDWFDRRAAEREHNAEISGYNALWDQQEALHDQISELSVRILGTPSVTLACALARLAEAAEVIRTDSVLQFPLRRSPRLSSRGTSRTLPQQWTLTRSTGADSTHRGSRCLEVAAYMRPIGDHSRACSRPKFLAAMLIRD